MKEVWDLYDAKGNKTGYTLVRGRPIPEGCYHLVVSVWIINNRGEYLLSQRHPDKPYPLRWECTGGAVLSGEDSLGGALREVPGFVGNKRGICMMCGYFIKMSIFQISHFRKQRL